MPQGRVATGLLLLDRYNLSTLYSGYMSQTTPVMFGHGEKEDQTTVLRFADPLEDFDRLVARFGGRWSGGVMPMDAYEHEDEYILRFDLPGVDPAGVDLVVEGNVLTVTAERIWEDTEGANWLLRERPTGKHSRQIRLGEKLDTSKVSASYENGVLTVSIPMREEAKPHRVSITTSAPEAVTVGSHD